MLEPGKPVLVTAQARIEGEEVKLSAQSFDDLEARLARNLTGLAVFVHDPAALEPLARCLLTVRQAAGESRSSSRPAGRARWRSMLPESYALSPSLGGEIGALAGITTVHELSAARQAKDRFRPCAPGAPALSSAHLRRAGIHTRKTALS